MSSVKCKMIMKNLNMFKVCSYFIYKSKQLSKYKDLFQAY